MKKNVIKEDIIKIVTDNTGYSQKIVGEIVDALLKDITNEMSKGNKVRFVGFGTFEPKEMAKRMGRNPHTNQPVPIPARIVPSFKPGNHLKEAVIECLPRFSHIDA